MLLDRLKTATQREHLILESDLNLLRPGLGLNEYGDLLERFYGFHVSWEIRTASILQTNLPGFFTGREKAYRAAADLEWLGRDASRLPWCIRLPRLNTLDEVLGSLYVLEGATLGAQVLARHFRIILGLNGEGCAFFTGYGDQTGAMWRSFGEELTRRTANSPAEPIVNSAIDTFRAAHEWLCGKPS